MAILRLSVAIEFGMCLSGLSGMSPWPVIFGKDSFFASPGGTRSRGGNRLPLGDQKGVSGDTQRGVVVEAPPSPSFVMSDADFLLEVQIVALDPP